MYTSAQSCYELVWSDEFDYEGLPDSAVWSFEEGASGWGNNELQYYTSDRLENARVENGLLTIEARKEIYKGSQYTSARLITYPKLSWTYGKIEASIKLPYGQGIWPAFWVLGDAIFEGTSWPESGEIDIMEMIGGGAGKDNVVHGTIHYADANNNHAQYGGSYTLNEGIFADTFHVFSIEWTSTQIKWFVDGIQYHVASLTPNYLTELKKDFFLLLNIAVGGNWPGYPDSSTRFPQQMQVDYVRVYQKDTSPGISGDNRVFKSQKNVEFKIVNSPDFRYNWTVPGDAEIISGQGTHKISVNWGCTEGEVGCQLVTNCQEHILSFPVSLENLQIQGKTKIQAYSENNPYSIPPLSETEYLWEVPEGNLIQEKNDSSSVLVNWGASNGYLSLFVNNQCGSEVDSLLITPILQLPFPNPETKHEIPGIIEAFHYDTGGEGIAYHDTGKENKGSGLRQDEGVDTQPNDGGENIGWVVPGEWVEYTVNVNETAIYNAVLRVAALNAGNSMEIFFNGVNRTGTINIPQTGSWSNFVSVTVNGIQLYETDSLMRVSITSGEFNFSRFAFNTASTGFSNSVELSEINVYPNPATDHLYIQWIEEKYTYTIHDSSGKSILSGINNPGSPLNVTLLDRGLYFIKITSDTNYKVLKFLKH